MAPDSGPAGRPHGPIITQTPAAPRYGHDPADADDRRVAQPWYQTKELAAICGSVEARNRSG